MDAEIWLLIFLFNGVPHASGPHDLDTCLTMAAVQPVSVCVNKDHPTRREGVKVQKNQVPVGKKG